MFWKKVFVKNLGKFLLKRMGMSPYLRKWQVYTAYNLTKSCFPGIFLIFFRMADL